MCKVHIDLNKLQMVALMLHIMAFHYLVRWLPYTWIKVLLKLIYVIKVLKHLFFLSRLACCILHVADKNTILLIPAYIPTHLNVSILGSTGNGIVTILTYQSMLALLQLGESATSRSLGWNAFNHTWVYQMSYVFSPLVLVFLVCPSFWQIMPQVNSEF